MTHTHTGTNIQTFYIKSDKNNNDNKDYNDTANNEFSYSYHDEIIQETVVGGTGVSL